MSSCRPGECASRRAAAAPVPLMPLTMMTDATAGGWWRGGCGPDAGGGRSLPDGVTRCWRAHPRRPDGGRGGVGWRPRRPPPRLPPRVDSRAARREGARRLRDVHDPVRQPLLCIDVAGERAGGGGEVADVTGRRAARVGVITPLRQCRWDCPPAGAGGATRYAAGALAVVRTLSQAVREGGTAHSLFKSGELCASSAGSAAGGAAPPTIPQRGRA